jgi:hypothetical protein
LNLKQTRIGQMMRFLTAVMALLLFSGNGLKSEFGPHEIKNKDWLTRQGAAIDDRAVGLLDKGELSNLITNFGIISDFHSGSPAFRWPRESEDVQQYGFGVGLLVLADGVLIASVHDPSSPVLDYGWEAYEGSLGGVFNDDRTSENTAADEVTPFLAFSDRTATWPHNGGQPFWPGPFRKDLNDPSQEVEGEFTSDRDVYAVLQDVRGVGLRVEQVAYSFSRAYAKNLIFVRYFLHNDTDTDMSEVYAGLHADMKADFYADDRIGAWSLIEGESNPSFFFKQDLNGIAQRSDSSLFEQWVGPVGWIGAGIVDSPDDMGVSSFHYYNDDFSPVTDEDLSAVLRNDASGVDNPERYFHGADPGFDDLSLQAEVDLDEFPGSEISFTTGVGPFSIPAGEYEELSLVFVIGADSTELDNNARTAFMMAREMHFQGSGPPMTPNLRATAGDREVLLSWDVGAETSVDALTGEQDFEGYRLYKSTDQGESWGEVVNNWFGQPVGYVPLWQCDIVDGITGPDPAYSPAFPEANIWLGNDTGLQHRYLDTDVINGVEVWYTVTSYDRGQYDPADPIATEPSYESPRGNSSSDANTVSVVPGSRAGNWNPGSAGGLIELNGAVSDGLIDLDIIDADALTGMTYNATFNDSGDVLIMDGDTVIVAETSLNLECLTTGSTVFTDMHTNQLFDYRNIQLSHAQPAVEGFRLLVENISESGVRDMGWTVVNGEETGFDWWTENRYPTNPSSYEEVVIGAKDWRVTITDTPIDFRTTAIGFGAGYTDTSFTAPLKLELSQNAVDGVWENVTANGVFSDLVFVFPGSEFLSPLGWDLVPGGAAWNLYTDPVNGPVFQDILWLRDDEDDTSGAEIFLKTNNGPPEAVPPSVGDEFTIITYKPFRSGLVYEFSTEDSNTDASTSLDQIRAVPNPIIVDSGLRGADGETQVMFTHLPTNCDITIYTVAGRIVAELEHQSMSNEGFTYWDLRNEHGQDVAYGLYVYVVKTPSGETHTGKLMLIR